MTEPYGSGLVEHSAAAVALHLVGQAVKAVEASGFFLRSLQSSFFGASDTVGWLYAASSVPHQHLETSEMVHPVSLRRGAALPT